jgi:chromosome segregation ATPase
MGDVSDLTIEVLKGIRSDLGDIRGELGEIRGELKSLNVRMENVETELVSVKTELTGLNRRVDSVLNIAGAYHSDHEARIERLEHRVFAPRRRTKS